MTKSNGQQRVFNKLANAIDLLARVLCDLGDALALHKNNKAVLDRIALMEKNIMATQKELTADLQEVLARQQKTSSEIKTLQGSVDVLNSKVVELEAIIEAGGTGGTISQELVDAVAAVKAQAILVDDQIPDVVAPPPPPDTPTPA